MIMSEVLDISDVNGICRLCLKGDGTIIPIFGRENTSRDCIPLSKKIHDCVSIKVAMGDGLPPMICVSCVHQLDSWHVFKNTCDSSQKNLNAWLQKTNPEIYAKNVAASRPVECEAQPPKKRTKISGSRGASSPVINLSSDDDDDVIITNQSIPTMNLVTSSTRRIKRNVQRPTRPRNLETLSIGTDEIEIFPVNDVSSKTQSNEPSQEEANNVPTSSKSHGLPDIISNVNESSSLEGHILPDPEPPEGLGNSSNNIYLEKDKTVPPTKDLLPNEEPQNDKPESNSVHQNEMNVDCHEDVNPPAPPGNSSEVLENIEEVQINESDFNSNNENDISEPLECDTFADITNDVVENNDDSAISNNNSNKDKALEKNTEGMAENSLENNSSFVIEKVTSLIGQEKANEDNNSQSKEGEIEESLEEHTNDSHPGDSIGNTDTRSLSDLGVDEESQNLRPDIVICDSSMVANIKEEPLSAGEMTQDEDDPLNFQTISVKRELQDEFFSEEAESEDVKPNMNVPSEATVNQYTPKRLKNGRTHCEPCRVSFQCETSYERHTASLRHKINFKLFRSGKAPTRKRGRALVQAVLGNTYERPSKGKGPFCCTECPSKFKHERNLTTHKKKHSLKVGNFLREDFAATDSQESIQSQEENTPKKPPQRQSAQNARFVVSVSEEDVKCDLCNQYFSTTPALCSHKRYCGYVKSHFCRLCNQKFSTTSSYARHRRDCVRFYRRQTLSMQQNNKPTNIPVNIPSPSPSPSPKPVPMDGTVLACTLCNLTFQSSPDLINHMQQNHMNFGKEPIPLGVPNFAKPNSISRKNDSLMHYCRYCVRSFSSAGALSSHAGYHVRLNVFCCKFCDQNFKDKLSFRQHMKMHIGDPSLNRSQICWICYTRFESQQDLLEHKVIHANTKLTVFSCGICGNSYNSKELLYKHKKNTHFAERQTEPTFDLNQPISEQVTKQSNVHWMEEDNKLYKCKICKKRFTTIGNLKRHNAKHKTSNIDLGIVKVEPGTQNRCNWCLRVFKNQVGVLNHRPFCIRYKIASGSHNIATPNLPIKCKNCKKWYASKSSMYKHKKRCRGRQLTIPKFIMAEPNQIKTLSCINCDQQFLSEETLDRHKQHCKPSIDKLTCDCGEVFSSVEQKLTHTDSCPANCTCKTCSLKFNSPEELETHRQVCQVQPAQPQSSSPVPSDAIASFSYESRFPSIECQKCKKKFVYGKCLKMHEAKCFSDRWPCTGCMEVFPTEKALANHKLSCQSPRFNRPPSTSSVQDSPTFKCEHCPMRFTSAIDLKQHSTTCTSRPVVRRRIHSVDRPYNCDICGKGFIWKANMFRHRKSHHSSSESEDRVVSSSINSPAKPNQESTTGTFKCNFCPDIVFHKQQGFLEHQRIHETQLESGVMLTCELCEKKLPESLYPMHMDEHMNDDFEETQAILKTPESNQQEPQFPCDLCGKAFFTPTSRKSHRASHYRFHDIEGIVSSKKQQKKRDPFTATKRRFKPKHIRCTICYKLLSINSLPKHKMMHRREAAEFYGGNETSNNAMKHIFQSDVPRSVTPNLAPDTTVREDESNLDNSQLFPCTKCDRTFVLHKSLMDHMQVHQDDSFETESSSSTIGTVDQFPYKCMYCDLSWKYKSVYERHLTSKKHSEIQKQLSGII